MLQDVRRRVARQREQERQREILNRQMDELKMREDAERRELEREAEVGLRGCSPLCPTVLGWAVSSTD